MTEMSKRAIMALAAAATVALALQAGGLKDKTIYLNPGHGGYTTGDRPTATINWEYMDTLSFYESRSNLWKALETRKHLERDGARVIMSRTRSGIVTQKQMDENILNENQESHAVPSADAVDRRYNKVETACDENGEQQIVGLERIACQVDSIKPDYFLSMHSNAYKNGTKVNYLVLLFRGETGKPYYENSDSMARVMWPYAFDNPLSPWSHYSPTKQAVVGDISWMGGTPPGTPNKTGATGYYAVLKFNAPGYLIEGSFHTYDPERQRLLSRDYCRMEGLRYYRGIRAYFNGKPEKVGYIAGALKSATEKMDHPRYTYRDDSDDQWRPINYGMVYLQDSRGVTIKGYRTDQEWNGIFTFFDLKPGKYTIRYEASGYETMSEEVIVEADKTTYLLPKLKKKMKIDVTFGSVEGSGFVMDYCSFGNGSKPMVILPGLSMFPVTPMGETVARQFYRFIDDYKVYLFDRKRDINDGYSIENMADDTAEAMKQLGINDAVVYGASQGGMIAQVLAAKHPELASRLVLCSTAASAGDVSSPVAAQWLELAKAGKVVELNRSFAHNVYSEEFCRKNANTLKMVEKLGGPDDLKRVERLASAVINFDAYPILPLIKCKTLVVGASNDKVLGGDTSPKLAKALGAELLMYDNSSHACFDEEPDLHDRVLEFLRK